MKVRKNEMKVRKNEMKVPKNFFVPRWRFFVFYRGMCDFLGGVDWRLASGTSAPSASREVSSNL